MCVLHFHVCPKLVCCSCICHGLEARLCVLLLILDLLWHELVSWSFILYGLLPLRAGPCSIVGFFLINPLFAHSVNLLAFLLCYSCYAILLFLQWCYLTRTCWASFGLVVCFSFTQLQWPSIVIRLTFMLLQAFLIHSLAYGLPWPISSSLGILDPLSFPRHPWPIPTLHSHGLLLTLLGISDPITISFTFGVYGLSINPLLTYFITLGLFRPILAFILLMGLLLLSLGSFTPTWFLQGPFIIF